MLNDAAIRAIKPAARPQKHGDTRGLYLYVRPSGVKSWRYDYRLNGLRKSVTFGLYPDVSLKQAREKLQAARTLVAAGQNPAPKKASAAGRDRFDAMGKEWLKKQAPKFAEATYRRTSYILESLLYPSLGALAVGAIEPPRVYDTLMAIERRGIHATAHRARQICGQVLRYAVVTGRATRDATADLRGALSPVVTQNHAAITDPEQVGALLRAIEGYSGSAVVKAALQLAPLVFVRPGELRTAEWGEINLTAKLWRIPKAKTKTRTDHLVPLSTQAVAILARLKPVTGKRIGKKNYVFPDQRTGKRPMSNNTLNAALRRLGYGHDEMTAHGFRALARTLLDERLRFPPDVIEVQLGHTVRGPLGSTYNRSAYLDQRVAMMQTWADELDRLRTLK